MDTMPTSCTRCGLTDEPMTTREAIAHDERCRRLARARADRSRLCPVHLIPDCSPLLNACARLTAPVT